MLWFSENCALVLGEPCSGFKDHNQRGGGKWPMYHTDETHFYQPDDSKVTGRLLRPCSSASAQSQSQLLATRANEPGGQGVGLHPPVTINSSPVQPADQLEPAAKPSYTTPVYRGCAPGRSTDDCSPDAQLIQPLEPGCS